MPEVSHAAQLLVIAHMLHPHWFLLRYFVQLLEKTWQVRDWDGPLQDEDKETKSLMMLPTDIALTKVGLRGGRGVEVFGGQDGKDSRQAGV